MRMIGLIAIALSIMLANPALSRAARRPGMGVSRNEVMRFLRPGDFRFEEEPRRAGRTPAVWGKSPDKLVQIELLGPPTNLYSATMFATLPTGQDDEQSMMGIGFFAAFMNKFAPGSFDWFLQRLRDVSSTSGNVAKTAVFSGRRVTFATYRLVGVAPGTGILMVGVEGTRLSRQPKSLGVARVLKSTPKSLRSNRVLKTTAPKHQARVPGHLRLDRPIAEVTPNEPVGTIPVQPQGTQAGAPTLQLPEAGARRTDQSSEVTFVWKPPATVPEATEYELIVFTRIPPSRRIEIQVANEIVAGTSHTVTLKADSYEWTILWKVRACLGDGEYGPWSEERSLSIAPRLNARVQ